MKAQDYKNLLESVAQEDFITEKFTDYKSKCCAIGHVCRLMSSNPSNYKIENCSDVYIRNNFRIYCLQHGDISNTNNYVSSQYPQSEPKQRVMAFLDEMIAKGL